MDFTNRLFPRFTTNKLYNKMIIQYLFTFSIYFRITGAFQRNTTYRTFRSEKNPTLKVQKSCKYFQRQFNYLLQKKASLKVFVTSSCNKYFLPLKTQACCSETLVNGSDETFSGGFPDPPLKVFFFFYFFNCFLKTPT